MKRILVVNLLMLGATAMADVSDKYFRTETLKKAAVIADNSSTMMSGNSGSHLWVVVGLLLFTALGLYLVLIRMEDLRIRDNEKLRVPLDDQEFASKRRS
jgi:hypothetical protein